ncbi:apolipoprotein B-100 [Esox lucius]|uniref:apolipoprotein B-100 n=1 Tax=Esox lucius TaxID=8010 RepID=UPI001476C592|nr:apolipoprotein B-100 [Esox lucius]
MGETKLCLLLLLGTCALAQQDIGNAEGQSQSCHLAKRFKNFRRFVYQYEAESLNGVHGATNLKNGPKVTCKVEVDVPQTCSFILRTTECSLSEVVDISADGSPKFEPTSGSEAFQAAMEKNPLKVMVEGQTDVQLFPEEDETITILNIKRGIVSALIVPALEDEKNKEMATLHGVCVTDFAVNSREDIATDVTVSRDLSNCNSFIAQRDHTSPLAIISGMQYPLSKLISSSQICNYKFDNQKKHMTAGSCTEKHIFLPFSHQTEYGMSTLVKQTLTLLETIKINERVFNHNEANLKGLPMEAAEDKAPVQTADAVLATLRVLSTLSNTDQGHQRASTFQRLVAELRGLKIEAMSPAVPEMVSVSNTLTWQALAQCGTPECSSAMLQQLRTFSTDAVEVDAVIYALGLMPNPSRLLVRDMLSMARYKQSKPIMFALGNVIRKLYQAEGKVTPEIAAVSEYLVSLLGADCAGEKELTFLTLRVVGNIGDIMEAADANVKTNLLKCMRQPATTLQVQLAAIQAFRRMSVTDEVRTNLQKVSSYAKGSVQKRLAAYLILMRTPEASDLELLKKILKAPKADKPDVEEQNKQVKAFVSSHIYNIIHSNDPETKKLGAKILDVITDPTLVSTHGDYTTSSRNYKMDAGMNDMQTSMQGNMIFDPTSQLPKEIMLETTLKAFGYNIDMLEIGLEGNDFEPTVAALFGKNGFFPDTLSKALYFAGDHMPEQVNRILKNFAAPLQNEKTKVPENIVREIVRNFNKLAKDLQAQQSPEATAYLRIMGTELGYIKDSELKGIAQNAAVYAEVLLKTMPTQFIQKLLASTDNEVFAHYIFMDNKFSLSTASGFPLKFSLSGTFAPGAKGGIQIHRRIQEVSFMPSVGVEFVTQMGVHIPEFVNSALEMHTNMYHESALNAKITMEQNQIKLSIPAPKGKTQLFRVSNRMLTVAQGQSTVIPHVGEGETSLDNCGPLFSGVKYCTTARYVTAGDNAPYFPLNGETKFAVNIEPTGEVSEYTATFTYELRSEGKEGRQKVDTAKMILRAEGAKATEATATMKYNRNRNVLTTNVQIPDYDVEAGIRVGLTDSRANGKSIAIDITNKNVPQLSLIGRAKLEAMNDGMLQVQLVVPALKTDAMITANMKNAGEFLLELTSDLKLPETTSIQGVILKLDENKVEVMLKSDMGSEIQKLIPNTEALQAWLKQFSDDILDHQVVKTDMKLRHILTKSLEAGNKWMDKMSFECPVVKTLKDNMPKLAMPTIPERLFLKSMSKFKYQFNKDQVTITIPMPFGGKSSEELRIPAALTTPRLSVPQVGLELASKEFQVPAFSIPNNYELTVPLFGMVEVSAKVNSNYYNWEGMVSGGNNSVDSPSYFAKFKVAADSPIELLTFNSEGTALISDMPGSSLKAIVNGSLSHKLIDSSFEVMETVSVSDKVRTTGNQKIKVISPLGLETSLEITSQASLAADMLIGDANMDGSVTLGSVTASTTYSQSFSVEPMKKEARAESTLRVNSPVLEIVSKIKAGYADEKLLIESNTNLNNDPIKHTTKVTIGYKEAQLTIQSDSVTKAEEKMIRSQVDFTASTDKASIRVENQADDTRNRVYSLLSGSLNSYGLEINVDASGNVLGSRASHKAALTLNEESMATSATTTIQSSPITFENVFNGGVDTTRAHVSMNTKGAFNENTAEFNMEGKVASSEGSLNSMFKGTLFDANTMNRVNLKVNKDGLTLSNNLVAGLFQMETENTNSLTLTLKSLALRSKTENFFTKENAYKHDISVDISTERELFDASMNVNNDLKIMDNTFVNKAMFQVGPYRMKLSGSLKGACSESEMANFEHTYEIGFADMTATAKCKTNGKYALSQMTHTADLEIAGLSTKFNSIANINSQTALWTALNLDSTVNIVAEPFMVDISALFNSNGSPNIFGIQNIELFNKFLLKAEPLAFSHSHEYKASTTFQLENGDSIKTNLDNKITSSLSPQEQHASMKMTSKLNNHEFSQELNAVNNAESMGMEVAGAVITTILNKASKKQEYAISGSLKYEKNSDSHFIQLPFVEHLPAVIEQVKIAMMMTLEDSKGLLLDIDTKYEVRAKIQGKIDDLQQVVESFDINLFIQDLKDFISSIETYIPTLMDKIPTEDILNVIKSIRDTIIRWIKKINLNDKVNAIYTKIEEILSKYEVEKMVETAMDEVVLIMKSYNLKERIQSAKSKYLKYFDFQGPLNNFIIHVNKIVNELIAFDFKQLVEDMSAYFDKLTKKIRSFDYNAFAAELKLKAIDLSRVPCFGKVNGEFRITSPDYRMNTVAEFHNSTTTEGTPEFYIALNSQATSTSELLAYTFDARVDLALPKMSRLSLSENIKVVHTAFSVEHQGAVDFYGTSTKASSKTNARATTEPYNARLVSNALFTTENGLSVTLDNTYNHKVNLPLLNVFSEVTVTQKVESLLQAGVITLTLINDANGKAAIEDYSDEGTHKCNMEVVMNRNTVKLTFTGATDTNNMKMLQNVIAEAGIFSHVIIDVNTDTKTPFIKSSVAELKAEANVQDLKMQVTGSHITELVGMVEGIISNSVNFVATPYEFVFDTKNKENTKVTLPFTLTGKVDLQNDIAITLNSAVQQASWTGLARFNQYKYSHYFMMDNGEQEIHVFTQMKGEANLEALREPITIPKSAVEFLGRTDFSLWYDTGLNLLLSTPQQTFDMDTKLTYKKNTEMFIVDIDIEPIFNAINKHTRGLKKNMIVGRDKAVALLSTSIDQAKAEYEKYNMELPKTITVPVNKVPGLNIVMLPFSIPVPDITVITKPTMHITSALSKVTLPKISLPKMQSKIVIPVFGDLTYEFSMKTTVLTVKANAGILNQDDFVVTFDASSTSEFNILKAKIDGTTTLKRNNGMKLASMLNLETMCVKGSHDSTISHNGKSMDASIKNKADINVPTLWTMEVNQEVFANAQEGLIITVSSPNAGLIGLQLQAKKPDQVKGRLYGRYPSDLTTDVDIVALKMSVINSEKLKLQTTWDMEIPTEMLLVVKKKVPEIMSAVPMEDILSAPQKIADKLEDSMDQIVDQSKVMYKRAAKMIESSDLTATTDKLADSIMSILRHYQTNVQVLLNAAIKFLRETQFQIPGFEGKMSGLEAYQKLSGFFAESLENVIRKVPEFCTSNCAALLQQIRKAEFTIPGSSKSISGKVILDDLMAAIEKIQQQVVVIVKKVGGIPLEDLVSKLSAFLHLTVEKTAELIVSLKSQDMEKLTMWISDVYSDAINSHVMSDITVQIEETRRIIREYNSLVKSKLDDLFAEMSVAQLSADIQSWIDSLIQRINAIHSNIIEFLQDITRNAESYVTVSDKQMDIEIPFPFTAQLDM